jgi:hypothetical protein
LPKVHHESAKIPVSLLDVTHVFCVCKGDEDLVKRIDLMVEVVPNEPTEMCHSTLEIGEVLGVGQHTLLLIFSDFFGVDNYVLSFGEPPHVGQDLSEH